MAVIVEKWALVELSPSSVKRPSSSAPYQAPEMFSHGIVGLVDGHEVVLPISDKGEGKFWSGHVEYELGAPHPEFERQFPNAKERMMARFL